MMSRFVAKASFLTEIRSRMANVHCSTNSIIFDEKLVNNRGPYFANPFNFHHFALE